MRRAATAGALLQDLLAQWGIKGKLQAYQAWQVWDEVVGPQIAAHARPARIRDEVLEVRVDQAVWMQQLQLLKPKLLARLNERLDDQAIRDIFLRRGAITAEAPQPQKQEQTKDFKRIILEETDKTKIEEALLNIDDPELRKILRTVFTHSAQAAKIKTDLNS